MVHVTSCTAVEVDTSGKVNKATRSTELAATPLVMVQVAKLAAHGLRFCSRTWTPFIAHAISVLPQLLSGKSMDRVVSMTSATLYGLGPPPLEAAVALAVTVMVFSPNNAAKYIGTTACSCTWRAL